MTDFYRDPVWQFVGVVIALITLAVTVYLFFLSKGKKSLAHDFPESIPLLTVGEEIRGKVEIFFDGNLIEKVYLLTLRIYNNGSIPIKVEDYVEPIRVIFSEGTQILNANVIDTYPISLNPTFYIEENNVLFSPMLLNSGDSFTLKALVSNPIRKPSAIPISRIVGVGDIRPPTLIGSLWPWILVMFFIGVGGLWGSIGVIYFLLSGDAEGFEFKVIIPLSLFLGGLVNFFYLSYQDIRRRRWLLQRYLGESFYDEFRRYFPK